MPVATANGQKKITFEMLVVNERSQRLKIQTRKVCTKSCTPDTAPRMTPEAAHTRACGMVDVYAVAPGGLGGTPRAIFFSRSSFQLLPFLRTSPWYTNLKRKINTTLFPGTAHAIHPSLYRVLDHDRAARRRLSSKYTLRQSRTFPCF